MRDTALVPEIRPQPRALLGGLPGPLERALIAVKLHTILFWTAALLTTAFLLAPTVFVFVVAFSSDRFITFPPSGLTLNWFTRIGPEFVSAATVSVELGLVAMLASVGLGVPAALALVRANLPGTYGIDAIVRSPLQIPNVVVGIAFLQYYRLLVVSFDLQLLGTFAGLLLAHCVITIPYMVSAVVSGLMQLDRNLEDAAYGLGCGPLRTFFEITLPLIRPAVFAGAFFAFLASFDNLPISLFLAIGGQTTLPVAMFFEAEFSNTPTLMAVSAAVTVFSAVAVVLFNCLVGLRSVVNLSVR